MYKSKFLMAAAAVAMLAASCNPSDEVKPVSVTVTVDESALVDVPAPDSYEVSLTNLSTAEVASATTENGVATLSVIPGLYNVAVLGSTTENGKAYTYSGEENSVNISDEGTSIAVSVTAAESQALIFKEIYYSCSGDTWYIRDQYYEIYNNSDYTVYLDGLCLAEATAYDYKGVAYVVDIENQENYTFVQYVWQIPGSGTDYPLAPGESAIVAQWATNHSVETLHPISAIGDLTSAEFEAITGESTASDKTVITDNAAINMLNPVSAYSRDQWMTSNSGPTMIMFFPETEINSNNMLTPTPSVYGGLREIPLSWIVDGVNCIEDQTSLQRKVLPSSIDAGAIWIAEGTFSGKSVARKVSYTTEDGRAVYQDTNNTTNDFEVMDTPQIRRNGAKIPAWNTWAN